MNLFRKEVLDQVIKATLKGIDIPSPPQLIVDLQMKWLLLMVNTANIEEIIAKDVGISGKVIKLMKFLFLVKKSYNVSSSCY